ncbi:MAG TPA: hypothetical protein VKW08_00040 [Xanthobacteraceae bacterium]|nr:hypothetical protein [Xanthobacteraceae bacterium]
MSTDMTDVTDLPGVSTGPGGGRKPRLGPPFALMLACGLIGLLTVPAGLEAGTLVSLADDPVGLADHMLDLRFDSASANHEIAAALDAGDSDLAASFQDLARTRNVAVDPGLNERLAAAQAEAASLTHKVGSFTHGFVTGEPTDVASLAGTATGDLFVFGDIRDAVREGTHLATGQPTDELILGLACTGIAITAGTYATAGIGAPVRVGLSLAKAARATGRMSVHMAEWVGRSLREVADWGAIGRAIGGVTFSGPLVAVRAAREAVKVEKAEELVRLAGDVGRVQAKAGTQAALDGLKLAEGPRQMSRIAQVAERYGPKTRAVLKLGGRAAIMLTMSAVNLFSWLFAAAWTLFGFCASAKRMVERATERAIARRKARALVRQKAHLPTPAVA